jgi:hypothetical protein
MRKKPHRQYHMSSFIKNHSKHQEKRKVDLVLKVQLLLILQSRLTYNQYQRKVIFSEIFKLAVYIHSACFYR